MKLSLTDIKKFKENSNNKLVSEVCNYIIKEWENYGNKIQIFEDVLTHGCQSGIVGNLVYYADTTYFYNKYKDEINELLYTIMNDLGSYNLSALFGDKWDVEDPLALNVTNQNLLAWFGFEETLRNIGSQIDVVKDYI